GLSTEAGVCPSGAAPSGSKSSPAEPCTGVNASSKRHFAHKPSGLPVGTAVPHSLHVLWELMRTPHSTGKTPQPYRARPAFIWGAFMLVPPAGQSTFKVMAYRFRRSVEFQLAQQSGNYPNRY